MIFITINGIPTPWRAHAGYGKRSFNPRFREKAYTEFHIREQYKDEPITTAVSIRYEFFMPIPKATSKKKRAQILEGSFKHVTRPDCTNMQKFFEDCLKEIVIKDDSQVVQSVAIKSYSDHPRTLITVVLL